MDEASQLRKKGESTKDPKEIAKIAKRLDEITKELKDLRAKIVTV